VRFQEAHGHWPQDVIANDLRLEDESEKHRERVREGALEQSTFDRWSDDPLPLMVGKHWVSRRSNSHLCSPRWGNRRRLNPAMRRRSRPTMAPPRSRAANCC
jgi:hypothetical protein